MQNDATRRPRGHLLTAGLATSVAMWAICYVAMMAPGRAVGEGLFALTVLCPVLGGLAVGRWANRDWVGGLLVGVVSASFNLLLIGSIIGSSTEGAAGALAWIAGLYGVTVPLAAVGAALGRRLAPADVGVNWYHAFTCVAATAVFMLLITGGLVTGLEAGLAVPDWPNSFGHNMLLYPLSEMVGGVYYEHAHRLYGMLVGLTTIVLVVAVFRFDDRTWMRVLALVVLVMVCGQGLMGGLRVTGRITASANPADMRPSTVLAIVHGVFGQIVFAAMVAMTAFTATRWRSAAPRAEQPAAATDRRWSGALVAFLLAQLVLGALYRHLNADPAVGTPVKHMLLTGHLLGAGLVTAGVILVGGRAWSRDGAEPVLRRFGAAMLLLVMAQLGLGIAALVAVLLRGDAPAIPVFEVVLTSAHQAVGALLLAGGTGLAMWTWRAA